MKLYINEDVNRFVVVNYDPEYNETLEDLEIDEYEAADRAYEIAKEEKTHVGEFQALLLQMDTEQVEELAKGKEEVEEMGS